MEFIISILQACEDLGVITGGSDSDGNYAFVVIDSTSDITIIVRPTGRITLSVGGEKQDFDGNIEINDDNEENSDEDYNSLSEFISAFTQALIDDNLDTKASLLMNVLDGMGEVFDAVSADDETDEEDTSEDDTSDEEYDDSEDDVTDDSSDEEYDDEDVEEAASSKIIELCNKDDEDEEFSSKELSSHELDILIDNAPALIDDMIETAARGKIEPFNIRKFSKVVGIKSSSKNSVSYHTGAQVAIRLSKDDNVIVELKAGNAKSKVAKGGTASANLLKVYRTYVDKYAKLNKANVTKQLAMLDRLIDAINNMASRSDLLDAITELTNAAGSNGVPRTRAMMTTNSAAYVITSSVTYDISYAFDAGLNEYKVEITATTGARIYKLLCIPAKNMVAVAAGFAKLATQMGNPAYPNGIFPAKRDGRFSNLLMRMAIKLGYRSEEDSRQKLARAETQQYQEAASSKVTKAQITKAAKDANLSAVKNEWGEWRITLKKEELPSEKKREAIAYYTDDAEEALHAIKKLREWADKHLKDGKEQAAAMPHNIEPSGFKRGEYVGYDSKGDRWRIRKDGTGGWEAVPQTSDPGKYVPTRLKASTLNAMIKLLEKTGN